MSEFDQTRQLVKYWKESKALYRPPRETLQIYEAHMAKISGRKDPRVLVLGVTPELRMLALKNGCRVTAVDNNPIAKRTGSPPHVWHDRSGSKILQKQRRYLLG